MKVLFRILNGRFWRQFINPTVPKPAKNSMMKSG